MTILDATAADVKALDDVQLRRLIARLAAAELRARGQAETGVNDSGDQRAPDGGIDVMVAGDPAVAGDILPALPLGLQVKATPMRRADILKEMRPTGALRPAIKDLAARGGGYVIAAGRDDRSADALRKALDDMRDGLGGEAALPIDFLDAGRLARWASQHPGVTRWLLAAAGRPTRGWHALEPWSTPNQPPLPYIVDEVARFRIGSELADPVDVVVGINHLRSLLATPRSVARLVGLSGMGKTRLAEALFDAAVGEGALPTALAVYGDAGANPETSPVSFAEQLAESKRRAILIVDNCPPALHRELEAVVRRAGTETALLTIDFDTGPDQPEHTSVFRFAAAGDLMVDRLLLQRRPALTWSDRARIVSFAEGNTRIALVLARTSRAGGELTGLSDPELLDRLFLNSRRGADVDLRTAAGAASLAYAFEVIDRDGVSEAERLAVLAGLTPMAFHRKIGILLERGMAQQRGVQRAVLPPAIAGWLAQETLAAYPTGVVVDHIVTNGSPRLTRSFIRRLAMLDSTPAVQAIARRLLAPDGPLGAPKDPSGDEMAMVRDLAHHAPAEAFDVAQRTIAALTPAQSVSPRFLARNSLVELLQSLARDPERFDDAVELMADLAMAENKDASDRVRPRLLQMFQMSHSGVQATTDDRLRAMSRWIASPEASRAKLGLEAVETALSFNPRHFYPLDINGIPQMSRGASFVSIEDVADWIDRSLAILTAAAEGPLAAEARAAFLRRFDALARRDFSIESALRTFDRLEAGRPWRGAWFAVCRALSKISVDDRNPALLALEERLRPQTLEARFDVWLYCDWHAWRNPETPRSDNWKEARAEGERVGYDAASDPTLDRLLARALFDPEAAGRAFTEGLAQALTDKGDGWRRIQGAIAAEPDRAACWPAVSGYIYQTSLVDPVLADAWIDALLAEPETLALGFAIVAGRNAHDDRDLRRMLAAIRVNDTAEVLGRIWWGRPADDASDELIAEIVDHLLSMRRPVNAYRFLDSRLNRDAPWSETLAAVGRRLIAFLDEIDDAEAGDHQGGDFRDHQLSRLAKRALVGPEGEAGARHILTWIRRRAIESDAWLQGMPQTMATLCARYPIAVLDILLDDDLDDVARYRLDHLLQPMTFDDEDENALSGAPGGGVLAWVDVQPEIRAASLARVAPLLVAPDAETPPAWSPLVLALLERPGGEAVREAFRQRLFSGGGSGSAADRYRRREPMIRSLEHHPDPEVRAWHVELLEDLARTIAFHERWERDRDQQFE